MKRDSRIPIQTIDGSVSLSYAGFLQDGPEGEDGERTWRKDYTDTITYSVTLSRVGLNSINADDKRGLICDNGFSGIITDTDSLLDDGKFLLLSPCEGCWCGPILLRGAFGPVGEMVGSRVYEEHQDESTPPVTQPSVSYPIITAGAVFTVNTCHNRPLVGYGQPNINEATGTYLDLCTQYNADAVPGEPDEVTPIVELLVSGGPMRNAEYVLRFPAQFNQFYGSDVATVTFDLGSIGSATVVCDGTLSWEIGVPSESVQVTNEVNGYRLGFINALGKQNISPPVYSVVGGPIYGVKSKLGVYSQLDAGGLPVYGKGFASFSVGFTTKARDGLSTVGAGGPVSTSVGGLLSDPCHDWSISQSYVYPPSDAPVPDDPSNGESTVSLETS